MTTLRVARLIVACQSFAPTLVFHAEARECEAWIGRVHSDDAARKVRVLVSQAVVGLRVPELAAADKNAHRAKTHVVVLTTQHHLSRSGLDATLS